MNVSRNFLLVGVVYLIIGIILGSYMGAMNDHTLAPLHAHINLLGFTLMTVFALVYRVFGAMAEASLARIHFWCHLVGSIGLLIGLFMILSDPESGPSVGPILSIFELLILAGVALFGWNALQNAK
jgi:sorbitol-specific phosphotransferase system component IIBC